MRPLSKARPAALICVLALVTPVTSSAVAREATAPNASAIHIDNFGRISEAYYRGGQPDAGQHSALAAFGIRTVIDLRSDDGDPADELRVQRAGMKYVHMAMTTHEPPTREMVDTFLQLVNDPANQPVYVHCVGGRHRTGVMTAVYRMTQHGWSADQAFQEMKRYKFGADFLHPEFKRFVYGFHTALAASKPSQ
jgi:tyrosine-protein phosphatase SIW14